MKLEQKACTKNQFLCTCSKEVNGIFAFWNGCQLSKNLFLMQIDVQKPKHVSKNSVDRIDFVY